MNNSIIILPRIYDQIVDKFELKGWGSEKKLESLQWMSALIGPIGEWFKEDLMLLDYGCGNGRLSNFLSGRLKDFTYYGLEPEGSVPGIRYAERYFGHDKRVFLGSIGSKLESEAIEKSHVVILGSIFTHLRFELFEEICDKLMPIIDRGGMVVFSTFISHEYSVSGGGGAYGIKDCYGIVYYTGTQINEYGEKRNLSISEYHGFLAQEVNHHRIFSMEK